MTEGLYIPAWTGRRRADDLEYPHPPSCSVQHLKSRKLYPQLTWEPGNWAPAHLDCNKAAGVSEGLGMGTTSEDW